MHEQLHQLLAILRHERNFNVDTCLYQKAQAINGYFDHCALDAAVVGLSGGVDSALVLGLLVHAASLPKSPIRRIEAATIPIYDSGSTGQDRAMELVLGPGGLIDSLECDLVHVAWVDGTPGHQHLCQSIDEAGTSGVGNLTPWSRGQILSIVRTPILYGLAARLQDVGFRSLVVGTTNRDEGSYIGFFGKASDAMVDLQPISDLHKSEVRKLAAAVGVGRDIIERTPVGDVYDGRSDEEMIGAPYDFLELYLLYRCAPIDRQISYMKILTDPNAIHQYNRWSETIDSLHSRNAHKYRVGSPAVHLDVYSRSVPGGW